MRIAIGAMAMAVAIIGCDSPTGPSQTKNAAVSPPAATCDGTLLVVVYNPLPGETAPPPFSICLRVRG